MQTLFFSLVLALSRRLTKPLLLAAFEQLRRSAPVRAQQLAEVGQPALARGHGLSRSRTLFPRFHDNQQRRVVARQLFDVVGLDEQVGAILDRAHQLAHGQDIGRGKAAGSCY